ncbi:MAG: fumarylacetoacetate hydrolase family protein [Desulfobacca sp.]|nr:fumarylacetoacetate hydrolase family protein [Desulfobacca sp.]
MWPLKQPPFDGLNESGDAIGLTETRLLAPCQPSKIVAVGLNYRDHAAELKMPLPAEPLIFLKPSTAVIGPEAEIIYPAQSQRVDYEAELGVVIGRTAHRVAETAARDYILGYTCFNDVTARDLQKKDGQFTRSKSFDTFAPLGPWIETEIRNPDNLSVEALVNGERRQQGNTQNMVFRVPTLISFISQIMTLLPGDVIATGTPAGIGPILPGDVVEIRVEGIGTLRNRVVVDKHE